MDEPPANPSWCFEVGEPFHWMLIHEYYFDENGTFFVHVAGTGQKDVFVLLWRVTQPIMFFAGDADDDGWVSIENVGSVPTSGIYVFGHHPPGEDARSH